jgi:type II secretory pathway pseudopilin PulG
VKPIIKQPNKERAFTIVELLTVMSIIVILISLLVPALNMVKRYARDVKQRAQFHSIGVALDLFHGEFDDYPDSDAFDGAISYNYCGAMKLAEAMMGQDLLGLHPSSVFRSDGRNPALPVPYDDLYPSPLDLTTPDPVHVENVRARKGPYLPPEGANVNTLRDLYGDSPNFGDLGNPLDPNGGIVLCDEYTRVRHIETGKKVGMPILYYKADTSKTGHMYQLLDNSQNIYNCDDNIELIDLDLPWDTAHQHPMAPLGGTTPDGVLSDPAIFYDKTEDDKVTAIKRPYRPDSYILISAGFDGLYGTDDDVYNFER